MKKLILLFIVFITGSATFGQSFVREKLAASENVKNLTSLQGADLNVFPNPVTGNHFQVISEVNPVNELKLLNITGKLVYQKILNQPLSKFEVELPVVPDGVYLLTVKQTDNTLRTIKLLIRSR